MLELQIVFRRHGRSGESSPINRHQRAWKSEKTVWRRFDRIGGDPMRHSRVTYSGLGVGSSMRVPTYEVGEWIAGIIARHPKLVLRFIVEPD